MNLRSLLPFVAATLLPFLASAQSLTGVRWDRPEDAPTKRSRVWKISAIAALAATAADAHSSWGREELNPLLRNSSGHFGTRGVAIKSMITGSAIGVQYLILRKHPQGEKFGTITNFVLAGVLSSAAANNYRLAAQLR